MPNMDKTGPVGRRMGRGRGGCNRQSNSERGLGIGNGGEGQGRGLGCKKGLGLGFGREWSELSEKDKKPFLEEEIKSYQSRLKLMQTRLDELKN
ncbi:MAG: DUF5320 family protein [Alphaproteobacteria bacterium]